MKEKGNWRKVVLYILKLAGAGIAALILLSIFSLFYYNPPVHVACKDGATGYKRESNTLWARMTEGFSHGKTDGNGYNNTYKADYSEIDFLLMGSSHTEALYVDDDKNMAYLLNKKFDENGDNLRLYNIGMSAHNFVNNLSNLKTALDVYRPSEYVVMETTDFDFDEAKIDRAIAGENVKLTSYKESDLMFKIQKIPYVKLFYNQFSNFKRNTSKNTDNNTKETVYADKEKTNEMLAYISAAASEYGCKAAIFYIPSLDIEYDGSIVFDDTEQKREEFAELCRQNDIVFIDMCDTIQENYDKYHKLPSGFSNTRLGHGHINEYGHSIIADKLYEYLVLNR